EKSRTRKPSCHRKGNGLPVDGAARRARNDEETRGEPDPGERSRQYSSGLQHGPKAFSFCRLQNDTCARWKSASAFSCPLPFRIRDRASGPLGEGEENVRTGRRPPLMS